MTGPYGCEPDTGTVSRGTRECRLPLLSTCRISILIRAFPVLAVALTYWEFIDDGKWDVAAASIWRRRV